MATRYEIGRRSNSDPELIAQRTAQLQLDPYAKFSPEERDERRKRAGKNSGKARRQNTAFKELFDRYLTDDKRCNIVKEFCEILCNPKVPVKDRARLFELILRVLGEDGTITAADREALSSVITLKIE